MAPDASPMQNELTLRPKLADLDKLLAAEKSAQKAPEPPAKNLHRKNPYSKPNAKVYKCQLCGHAEDSPIKIFHHRRAKHAQDWDRTAKTKEEKVVGRKGALRKGKRRRTDPMKERLTEAQKAENKRAYNKKWYAEKKDQILSRQRAQRKRKAKEPGRRPQTPEQRRRKNEWIRQYRLRKKEGKAGPVQAALEIHSNGHLPKPFLFCPQCGEKQPTREYRGRELPAAYSFCGYCGFKLPTFGAK